MLRLCFIDFRKRLRLATGAWLCITSCFFGTTDGHWAWGQTSEPVAGESTGFGSDGNRDRVQALIESDQSSDEWSEVLAKQLEIAADNASEIEAAWRDVPESQRPGMQFLLTHMPPSDLRALTAKFLLEHVDLAYQAKRAANWGSGIPDNIFLNDVLPYANINESRDDVRRELRERFWPHVKDMESISAAAAKLNQVVFQETGVRYSTQRRRADQGPRETMETKMASCTGLSILLIDACRACGIPARFVGTPRWSDNSGNHSWVEIWDGDWCFTGAAEPTGDRLNQAWFVGRAAQATPGDPMHGIYAVSYRNTGLTFPMVWRRGAHEVQAVDVTKRYLAAPPKTEGVVDVYFRALLPGKPQRCRANISVLDGAGEVVFRGQTLDESADTNNHLTASLKPGKYRVEVKVDERVLEKEIEVDADGQLISLPTDVKQTGDDVLAAFEAWLSTPTEERGDLKEQAFATKPLTRAEAESARDRWVQHYWEKIRVERAEEHQARLLKWGELEMPYDVKVFGEKPAAGHSLYISMHGGGGAPKRVNDQQWQNQKRLYELEEGIYIAPRAPTDTWNLWHQDHIDRLFGRLIENMIAFEGIDPDRVYITGYSAGGDGVYQVAPRMADRFAAAAMMAGHPNETQPLGLRNLAFTLHMGENDSAYNRNKIAAQWAESLKQLQAEDPQGYVHWVEIHQGKGHWMDRQDAEGVKWMAKYRRNMIPDRIVWLQDDVLHNRFYWLSTGDQPAKGREKVVARRDGQTITIEESQRDQWLVRLRDDMVDLDQPVTIKMDDKVVFQGIVPRTIVSLVETCAERGDPSSMFSAQVRVQRDASPNP